jgi:hypothetical protein
MVNIAFGVEFFRPFFWLHKNFTWRILYPCKNSENIILRLFIYANIYPKIFN